MSVFSKTAERVTCPGCGKEFKGERGLASHQNHRNALVSCKTDAERAEMSKPIETGLGAHLDKAVPLAPRSIEELREARANGETGAAFRDEVIAARDAEQRDIEAAEAAKVIETPKQFSNALVGILNGGGILASAVAAAEPVPAPRDDVDYDGDPIDPPAEVVESFAACDEVTADLAADVPTGEDTEIEVRNDVIANARRYARVPEFRTVLVHLKGNEDFCTPTAWRWHPEDAEKLMATAYISTVVRVTKHDEGRNGETVLTDFHWRDGVYARVTEKFAI